MKQYINVDKNNLSETIKKINLKQNRTNYFYNVSVKPYTGKKYNKENTVTITIG